MIRDIPAAALPSHEIGRALLNTLAEIERQDEKWGVQNHPDGTGGVTERWLADLARQRCQERFAAGIGTWRSVLGEEIAEAFAEDDPARLREELIQVAAVALQWAAAIDRRQQEN